METPDVLIIGAGIVGCSLARELAKVRSRIVVVDRGRVGGGSSSAAAGLLVPTFSEPAAGPLVDLCRASALLYESWLSELREDGAADVGFRRAGQLDIALTPEDATRLQRSLAEATSPGRRAEWLDAKELRRREPALTERVLGAALYPDDAQVDPVRLTHQVARVATLAGVVFRENEPVLQVERKGDCVTAVRTSGAVYHPGVVVLTTGAWVGGLASTIGLHLPTRPVKGQMLMADCRVTPVQTPLHAGDALLVPRPDGSLIVGVTVEEVGFDEHVSLDGLHQILQGTTELVPSVGQLAFSHAWYGLRPATPDEWPFIGPVPPVDNLWVSTGHFRKGILLAPISAQLLAGSILSGHVNEDLAPFKPTRRVADG